MNLGTILGVWAHPDDETFLSAGLMAKAVRDGDRVVCITATKGEAGSLDEKRWPPSEMGKIREAELMECLEILGVTEHHWLDYYDGRVGDISFEEGTERIAGIMRAVNPNTVLTFGPDGMTGHPDHISISQWATSAFENVASPGASLYYATTIPEWAEEFVPRLQQFNIFGPGTPPITPRDELAIDLELSGELADLKLKAIQAHVSQIEGMIAAFGPDLLREGQRFESFRLARSKEK